MFHSKPNSFWFSNCFLPPLITHQRDSAAQCAGIPLRTQRLDQRHGEIKRHRDRDAFSVSERDVETEINTERTGDGEALESGRNVNLDTSSSSNFHTKEGSGVWKCSDIHFSRPAMSSDIQPPEIPPFQAAPATAAFAATNHPCFSRASSPTDRRQGRG